MASLLNGKALADRMIVDLRSVLGDRKLALAVVRVGTDPVVEKFILQKEKIAEAVGVSIRRYDYEASVSTGELRTRIATIVHDADPDGIIIQLPLPGHVNMQHILNAVPVGKDVDALSARAVGDFAVGKAKVLPPIVGAIQALFEEYRIDYRSKYTVIVGAGTLVGHPVALWLLNEKATFSAVDIRTPDLAAFTRQADIIVTGVGKPGLITGDMVKEGVVVIDAGTSEGGPSTGSGRQTALVGDVDFDSVSQKASYLTPVPGGVGPLTVAMIYQNLLTLAKR